MSQESDFKRQDLEKRKVCLQEEIEAVSRQINSTLSAVDRVRLERHKEDLFRQFDRLESQLSQLGTPKPNPPNNFANPFQPLNGRIEQSEQFFNRERELRDIFDFLNAGSGVELLGDRQIGKSSVLQQIKHRAASALRLERKPIYLNLQEVHTEAEFYESLCEKLEMSTCKGYSFFRAMRDRRVVLLLDEAEKMSWDGFTREVREQLRSLAEGENAPLRLVVAARTPLDRLFPDSHESGMTSPFQGICVRVDLKAWDQATVQRFITSKLEGTGVCFSNAEMEKLWLESQGHPQRLMKACFDLYRQYCQNL